MASVSMCMIVKNESANLARLLPIVKQFVDEMIVVDTGSEDDSITIAEKLGAQVHRFDWVDDFSVAKNYALEQASSDWILFIDGDELIPKKYLKQLAKLLDMDFDAFTFIIQEYTNDEYNDGFILNNAYGYKGYYTYRSTPRLFRNKYKFSFPVHETIEPSLGEQGGRLANIDVPIVHLEQNKGDEFFQEKQKKYLSYMLKTLEKNPKDVKLVCDIALSYFKYLKEPAKALEYLKLAKEIDLKYARLYLILGELSVSEEDFDTAIGCYKHLVDLGENLDSAFFNLGQIYKSRGENGPAIDAYKKAIEHGSQHKERIEEILGEL